MGNLIIPFVSDVSAEIGNRFLYTGDSNKTGISVRYAHISYNGASWIVDPYTDACGISAGNLVWGSPVASVLNISVSGYANLPCVSLARASVSAHVPFTGNASNTIVVVGFTDFAGGLVSTQSTLMDFHIVVLGV